MLTMRDVMEMWRSGPQSSPDGKHWEPAIPCPMFGWRYNWRDAWEVLNARAVALRNTTKADLSRPEGTR